MNKLKTLIAISAISIASVPAMAIPAKLGLRIVTQPDGSTINAQVVGDENMHFTITEDGYLLTQDSDGFYRLADLDDEGTLVSTGMVPVKGVKPSVGTKLSDVNVTALNEKLASSPRKAPQTGVGMYKKGYPTTGSPRCLVILAEFSDVKFSKDYDAYEYFNALVNGDDFTDFGGTGSIRSYFKDQSGGKFTPIFDVYGPVTLPETQKYYGDNRGQTWDPFAHYMVSHAAKALNDQIDYSKYDLDNDGEVDFIYIFYAGQGEHNQGGPDTIWPHAGYIQKNADFVSLDGKWINQYACSSELEGDVPAGIGAFIHEYSHVLGLPDLYTLMYTDRFTPGFYSVLDYGLYNNNQRTPCNYTAYERNALGWNEPIMLDKAVSVELDEIGTGQFGLIPTSKNVNEFFLLENRQQTGWDTYLPAHGMVIWHVDYNKSTFENNQVNDNRDHQRVDLIEANGIADFPKYSADYTFPGTTGKTSFTPQSSPAMKAWTGETMAFPVTNIREENGKVYFDVAGGNSMPAPEPAVSSSSKQERYLVVEWKAVEGATDYLVTLSSENGVVEPYNLLSTNGETSYKFENLPEGIINYTLEVTATDGERVGKSKPLAITLQEEVENGIGEIDAESQAPVYYNLQGVRIFNPEKGTIVIERRGKQTRKIKY